MYFFFTFLFSITVLGSVMVGPFSIRVYMTILMTFHFIDLWIRGIRGKYIAIDHSFMKLYILFLLLMGIAQLLNGEIFEYQYFKRILAYHLVCIVAFLSIESYVNSCIDMKKMILLLMAIMLFNNIVTILQFLDNDIGWQIGNFFGDVQEGMDYAESHDSFLGFSRTPGILDDVVANAYTIAVLCPLSLCLINKHASYRLIMFVILSTIIAFTACFMTQQRAAFGLYSVSVLAYFFFNFRRSFFVLSFLGAILIFVFDFGMDIDNIDLGRLSDTSNDSRSSLYRHAFNFIPEHSILGGPVSYQKLAGKSSHNIVLDSWICAGFFGFLTMMVLFIRTLIFGFKILLRGLWISGHNNYMIFCAISVLSSMVYGLTHNTSYLAGNVMNFITLALMLKTIKIDCDV